MTDGKKLKDLLQSPEEVKVGEFDKDAQAKLAELAEGATEASNAYRAERDALRARWNEQQKRVADIKKVLESHAAEWERAKKKICDGVIAAVATLKTTLDAKLGPPERTRDAATAKFEAASAQLDGWKGITTWIDERLNANEALLDEYCKTDVCEDRLFGFYLFYFELLPAHSRLGTGVDEPPDEKYCASPCAGDGASGGREASNAGAVAPIPLVGDPWLIDEKEYEDKLVGAWEAWRAAGEAQVRARYQYEQIEADREKYEAARTAEAKREKAREVLRELAKEDPSSPPTNPNDQTQAA